MVDLIKISERLNKSSEEMAKFAADPVAYLKNEGLILSEQQAEELLKAIKNPNPPRIRLADGSNPGHIVDNNSAGIDWEDR